MLSQFLETAKNIMEIKKLQVPLPIARKAATVTPLVVGDDLALRTSITNPHGYDREMIKLLHKHMVFNNEDKDEKPNFDRFISEVSNIDKICLIWGIYRNTYETLGKRKIICENPECRQEFEKEIIAEDLLHDDTLTMWDEVDENGETVPFTKYSFQIDIDYDKYVYSFDTRIPTIKDNNRVLSMLSTDMLQKNLEQGGSLFALHEQMTLLTRAIVLKPKGSDQFVRTESMQEIAIAFDSYIPKTVSETYFNKYTERFKKYDPRFYASIECPICQHKFDREVNIELEFFRRSIFNTGEGVESL
jgi:hypothetical protein